MLLDFDRRLCFFRDPCVCVRRRFEMDRDPAEARFCAECNRCHSAEEGDLWAESSMLGLRITYFACMDGKVYDITGERRLFSQRYRLFLSVTVVCMKICMVCYQYPPSLKDFRAQFHSISM